MLDEKALYFIENSYKNIDYQSLTSSFIKSNEVEVVEYINQIQDWKFISGKISGAINYSKESNRLNHLSRFYLRYIFNSTNGKYVSKAYMPNVIDANVNIKELTDYELFTRYVLLKHLDFASYTKEYKFHIFYKNIIQKEYLHYHNLMTLTIRELVERKINHERNEFKKSQSI